MFSFSDKKYMKRALSLAKQGRYTASPNPAVGCVIVKNNTILGEGYHQKAGLGHAEVNALKSASYKVEGATCYVTLEPCSHYGLTPPCAVALVENKVSRVVIAMLDINPQVSGRGVKILEDAGIKVEIGLMADKAYNLNRAFFKSISSTMPYVVGKVGMSLDAKTALHTGQSKWITNAKSRSYVQKLRAHADAIITGCNTVIMDNPSLNVRFDELPKKVLLKIDKEFFTQPLKVILDTSAKLNYKDYKIFKEGTVIHVVSEAFMQKDVAYDEVLVPTDDGTITLHTRRIDSHISVLYVPDDEGHTSLKCTLHYLNSIKIREVLVEAGANLTTAFLEQGVMDELCVFTASKILGDIAKSAFLSKEIKDINSFMAYNIKSLKKFDNDIFVRYLIER